MNESMQAEAVSVSLINTLREIQKCMEEMLRMFGGSGTARDERPKIAPSGKSLFEQIQTAQGIAGNANSMAQEVLKDCHSMQSRLGE